MVGAGIPALLPALDSLDLRRRTDSGPASVPPDTVAYRIQILRDENDLHGRHRTTAPAMVLHRLPEGRLSVCAAEFDAESLRSALDKLEADCPSWASATNNLKPGNLYVTSDGRLIPVRYHFARFWRRTRRRRIRTSASVRARTGAAGKCLRRGTVPLHHAARISDICSWARCPITTGSCGRQKPATGSSIPKNRPVIAPQFVWAADFREGRAEVQTTAGHGPDRQTGTLRDRTPLRNRRLQPYTGCFSFGAKGSGRLPTTTDASSADSHRATSKKTNTSKLNNLTKIPSLWKGCKMLIIGSGPGYTAAIYTSWANLASVLHRRDRAGRTAHHHHRNRKLPRRRFHRRHRRPQTHG